MLRALISLLCVCFSGMHFAVRFSIREIFPSSALTEENSASVETRTRLRFPLSQLARPHFPMLATTRATAVCHRAKDLPPRNSTH
jgi:hypothetical protein